MKSKEEIALAWIIVALAVIPMVILYPPVLLIALLIWASWTLWTNYSGRIG